MLLSDLGQDGPPPGGYTVERFERHLVTMERRYEQMRSEQDPRAVFQLTYLTFSKQVLAALKAGRFSDFAWASDMCGRFVEMYLGHLERWDQRDLHQARVWRSAFEQMKEGRLNLLQAMFLGMNAHINFDLAFCTLGACRWAGDLEGQNRDRTLASSQAGVPLSRYKDFLEINQIGWESLPAIADAVLSAFSKTLYWGNRATFRLSRFWGEQLLLEARDAAWVHTCLLLHADDGLEREQVARLIDAYASSWADGISAVSLRPMQFASGLLRWIQREERVDSDVQAALVQIARRHPAISELALQQLAFVGAEPLSILETLWRGGDKRLTGLFARRVLSRAPSRRREQLTHFLSSHDPRATDVAEVMLEAGPLTGHADATQRVHARWNAALALTRGALASPEVKPHPVLEASLVNHAHQLEAKLRTTFATPARFPQTPPHVREWLRQHPDAWVRLNARVAFGAPGEDPAMASLIERVLFLKDTQVFIEVDPTLLVLVAQRLEELQFKEGQVLLHAGRRAEGVLFIRSGTVEVSQLRESTRVQVATLGPGEAVGELSVLNETVATADCTAKTEVTAYFAPATVLNELLHEHPRLAIGLLRMLSQRLMETTRRVVS